MASTMWMKRMPSTAQRPPRIASGRESGADQHGPQPGVGERAVAAGAAGVALLACRFVDGVRELVDHLAQPRESGPKAREMVADLWSRSGASAAPAQISAPHEEDRPGHRCAPRPRPPHRPPARPPPPTVSVPVPSWLLPAPFLLCRCPVDRAR